MTRRIIRTVSRSAAVIGLTLLLDHLVVVMLPGVGHAYPFWPAAGLAVAAVLADGFLLLPAVGLGSFLFNLQLQSALPLLALVLALGATLQTAVATALGRRIAGARPRLRNTREVLAFLLATGPLSCLIGAAVSVVASQSFQILSPAQLLQSGFTWWAGDVLGVVVVTPIVLMLLPEMHESWDGRRQKLLVPSLLLVLMVQLVYGQAVAGDHQAIHASFRTLGRDVLFALEGSLELHGQAIDSVRRFYLSSDQVSAEEFRSFTGDLFDRLPGLHGLSWNPLIAAADRRRFELSQSQDPLLADATGYRITERDSSGKLVPAAVRSRYVPVALIEPLLENRKALGFDIQSNPVRARAIRQAQRSGLMQATEPITLVQERGSQQGVLVLQPVQRHQGPLLGFAVGVYRLGDLLQSSFGHIEPDRLEHVVLELRQGSGPLQDRLIARFGESREAADDQWSLDLPVPFAGQEWVLRLLPSPAAVVARQTTLPRQLLLACLWLVILHQAFLLVITARDQRERRRAQISHHLALHDPLTDLLNRRGFLEQLEQARADAEAHQAVHALLLFDLDHFKPINDTVGHQAGDQVLQQIARVLQQAVRADDALARIGGDEFAAILWNCPPAQALRIAEGIRSSVAALSIRLAGRRYPVTVSLGLRSLDGSAAPLPAQDVLLHQTDQACYEAKRSGRNRVVLMEGQ